jgi:predicted acylesterase/phospholipase RssA
MTTAPATHESDWDRRLRPLLDANTEIPESTSGVLALVEATTMRRKEFRKAREALEIAWEQQKQGPDGSRDPASRRLAQKLAVCTYKDNDLAPGVRLKRALAVLEEIGLRDPEVRDSETLRLGGAVFKRRWQCDGQLEHLIEALNLYRSAYELDPIADLGYGGVNAAFILDLLAARARTRSESAKTDDRDAALLTAQARALREDVRRSLDDAVGKKPELANDKWFNPTYAEVLFGLGEFEEARKRLKLAVAGHGGVDASETWEAETSFRQFVAIAKAHRIPVPAGDDPIEKWHPAWVALAEYFGGDEVDTRHALECYRGKVGLALSGGGFRASLYHIGVLARLAEIDALRRVEVISTVSGGSIVGAHYYLEVQDLLQRKTDAEIGPGDYIEIVQRVAERFLAGVQDDLRMRALSSVRDNLRMIFQKDFSRSHKIGELYESHLFARIGPDASGSAPSERWMKDLVIADRDGRAYRPKAENWKRSAQVPILLLNTTSLNSGHAWFFTAAWMGEPAGLLGSEVDKNQRYERIWYDDPSNAYPPRGVRLGHAVAASAGVPGLFAPLELHDLYSDTTVRLVDGGVHDNQGIQGLLDEGCTLILCSDASGQMGDAAEPPNGVLGVALRSNSILMDRVREAEYQDVAARVESMALEGLFFVHTKEDLPAPTIPWVGNAHPVPAAPVDETPYGIHPGFQEKLAALRTDLDCFSEVEAYGLMLSGYNMAKARLESLEESNVEPVRWGDFAPIDEQEAPRKRWPFRKAEFEALLAQPPDADDRAVADLARQLEVGSSLFLRAFQLVTWLEIAGAAVVVGLLVGLGFLVASVWSSTITQLTWGGLILAVLVVGAGYLVPMLRWLNPEKVARGTLRKAAAGVFGGVLAKLQLAIIDPLYRRRGSMSRLLGLRGR